MLFTFSLIISPLNLMKRIGIVWLYMLILLYVGQRKVPENLQGDQTTAQIEFICVSLYHGDKIPLFVIEELMLLSEWRLDEN